MYQVHIYTTNEEFLAYLKMECQTWDDHLFSFVHREEAIELLKTYFYYYVKEHTLRYIIAKPLQSQEYEVEKHLFLTCIPKEIERKWSEELKVIVKNYLEQESLKRTEHTEQGEPTEYFYAEGFITFRLKDYKKNIQNFLEEEYYFYKNTISDTEGLNPLLDYMKNQPYQYESVLIETKEDGTILLKDASMLSETQGNKLPEHCLYIEQNDVQEDVVVQTVLSIPKKVVVSDAYNRLNKETVIVLKQLFGTNITFQKNQELL